MLHKINDEKKKRCIMRKSILVLIVFTVLILSGCEKTFDPLEIKEMCLQNNNIFFQDQDFNVYKIDILTGKKEKIGIGNLTSLNNEVFFNDGKNLIKFENEIRKNIGTSPDFYSDELIAVLNDTCFYKERNRIITWNCNTSISNEFYSFANDSDLYVITAEKMYYGGIDGLFEYDLVKKSSIKIFDGYITSMKEYNNRLYFAASISQKMPSNNYDIEDGYIYSGADFYMLNGDQIQKITTIERIKYDETNFALFDDRIFITGYDEDNKHNQLYIIDYEGKKECISLPSEIESNGAVDVNENYFVSANKIGTKFYIFGFKDGNLKLNNI